MIARDDVNDIIMPHVAFTYPLPGMYSCMYLKPLAFSASNQTFTFSPLLSLCAFLFLVCFSFYVPFCWLQITADFSLM